MCSNEKVDDIGFDIRCLHLHGQSPDESGLQPFLQPVDLSRVLIGGEHHLAAPLEQAIEDVEELLLRAQLLGEKLNESIEMVFASSVPDPNVTTLWEIQTIHEGHADLSFEMFYYRQDRNKFIDYLYPLKVMID